MAAPEGRLPTAAHTAAQLRSIFERLGFVRDREIVALMGGSTSGLLHETPAPQPAAAGAAATAPAIQRFDNSYFVRTLAAGAAATPLQKALLEDGGFRGAVEAFAKDEEAFVRDYAAAVKKLSTLGQENNLYKGPGLGVPAGGAAGGSARGRRPLGLLGSYGGSRNSFAGLIVGEAGSGYLPGVLSGLLLGASIMAASIYAASLRRRRLFSTGHAH